MNLGPSRPRGGQQERQALQQIREEEGAAGRLRRNLESPEVQILAFQKGLGVAGTSRAERSTLRGFTGTPLGEGPRCGTLSSHLTLGIARGQRAGVL